MVPFNVMAALAILLSNFECGTQSRGINGLIHHFTSSRVLCIFQSIALTSVVLQLLASEYLVAWTGVFYLLNYTCVYHKDRAAAFMVYHDISTFISGICKNGTSPDCGQDLLPQAQQLIGGISRDGGPASSWTSIFSPISADRFEGNLNLQEYCSMATDEEPALEVILQQVWLGALLTALSQILMSVALSGERQRAGVHEEHSTYTAMSNGMGQLRDSMSNNMGQLGQNMQNMASGLTQSSQNYGPQILSGFKGRQGH
eukprot:symbB.v1.2.029214.t1/scaffold3172.1/size61981/2